MEETIEHISMKAWGDYSASDYTLEQWHQACLIHQHQGAPTAKGECKLPVKTPNGALNKNGVFAAAAALAGARTPIDASSAEKVKAAKALIRYYKELDQKPPESLLRMSGVSSAEHILKVLDAKDVLAHFGVKGMRWGVRRSRKERARARESAQDRKARIEKAHAATSLSTADLQAAITRMRLEEDYARLVAKPGKQKSAGRKWAEKLVVDVGTQQVKHFANKAIQKEVDKAMGWDKSNKNKSNKNKSKSKKKKKP